MYLPRVIYNLLPVVYIVAGLWAVAGLDMTHGKLSGVMLGTAGFIIWRMRINYRRNLWKD